MSLFLSISFLRAATDNLEGFLALRPLVSWVLAPSDFVCVQDGPYLLASGFLVMEGRWRTTGVISLPGQAIGD